MYCKFCGTELKDEDNFCYHCGAPVAKDKSSKAKDFIINLLKAVGYFFALDGIVTIIVAIYTFIVGFKTALENIGALNLQELINQIYSNYYSKFNIISIVAYIIALFALFIFFLIRKKNFLNEVSLHKVSFKTICLSIVLGFSVQVFVNFVLGVIISMLPSSVTDSFTTLFSAVDNGNLIIEIINVAIFAPVFEEILFRGLIFTRIRRSTGRIIASLIAAVIFGLAHGNIVAFFYTFFLGFLICLVLERTNSIIPGIFIHAAFNGGSFIMGLFPNNLMILIPIFLVCAGLMVLSAYLLIRKPNQEEDIYVETL